MALLDLKKYSILKQYTHCINNFLLWQLQRTNKKLVSPLLYTTVMSTGRNKTPDICNSMDTVVMAIVR